MNRLQNAMSKWAFASQPATYDAQLPGLQLVPGSDGTQLAVVSLDGSGRTLLYFHGNAEDLGNVSPILRRLNELGFRVLCFDYRGFGLSQGSPTERAVYDDTDAVLKALDVETTSLLVVGVSVGSAGAVDLASRQSVAGLVLLSPLASMFRTVLKRKVPFVEPMDNLQKAKAVTCPSLVIHGTNDSVIRLEDAQRLLAALPSPKRGIWLDGADHNDVLTAEDGRAFAEIGDFEGALTSS